MTDWRSRTTTYPTREAWLEARRTGIGGSDVPAILGLSPWASPLDVWASKMGLDEERESTYSMRRGNHMESFIAEELASEANAIQIARRFGSDDFAIVRDPLRDCLAYSPDALIIDHEGVEVLGEWKSQIRSAAKWAEDVPEDVQAQVQHGMFVMDLPACYVACDLGNELAWKRIERDPSWASEKMPLLLAWWDRHIVGEEAPAPTSTDKDVLNRIYPEDFGASISLPVDFMDTAEDLERLKAQEKAIKADIDAIENGVRALMKDATTGVLPDGSGWTWKVQHRKEFVVKASSSRVLRRFKAKGDK